MEEKKLKLNQAKKKINSLTRDEKSIIFYSVDKITRNF